MNSKDRAKKWKGYEELIKLIYEELEPLAEVKHNDFIYGETSKIKRQIDISIRSSIAGHDILVIVQAKDQKRKVDVNVVGEFASVLQDVKASKGILICNAGFTKSAREYAKNVKIDLCSAYDSSSIDWQKELKIPVLKKSININLNIKHEYSPKRPTKIQKLEFVYPKEALQEFMLKWENNLIPKEQGKHYVRLQNHSIIQHEDLYPTKCGIEYEVKVRTHFKHFIPIDYRGIQNYLTDKFTPSFISFEEPIAGLNDNSWKYVEDPSIIPLSAVSLKIEILNVDLINQNFVRLEWD